MDVSILGGLLVLQVQILHPQEHLVYSKLGREALLKEVEVGVVVAHPPIVSFLLVFLPTRSF